jgi:hypothetical protein
MAALVLVQVERQEFAELPREEETLEPPELLAAALAGVVQKPGAAPQRAVGQEFAVALVAARELVVALEVPVEAELTAVAAAQEQWKLEVVPVVVASALAHSVA